MLGLEEFSTSGLVQADGTVYLDALNEAYGGPRWLWLEAVAGVEPSEEGARIWVTVRADGEVVRK